MYDKRDVSYLTKLIGGPVCNNHQHSVSVTGIYTGLFSASFCMKALYF
jgi:hypothetical protein